MKCNTKLCEFTCSLFFFSLLEKSNHSMNHDLNSMIQKSKNTHTQPRIA